MKAIQFSSIIDGVQLKKDGTLSVKLGTQQLSAEDTAKVFELGNKQIWVAMAETAISMNDLDIPEEIPEFKGDKTPSQRLRNVLYVAWKEGGEKGSFDDHYKKYMERLIEHHKDKLS